jgi:hypothetical protein
MGEIERLTTALREVMQYNGLRNDLDAYLLDLCKWALKEGDSDEQPRPERYGLKAPKGQT